ncbi:MAG: hypothetical protein JO154_01970 [Chitinophaga sp.]|uniref:hypothetical protein n=1 Tax=Chitinophaga sp. TaxID=1869181 RepID=UPI0025BA7691|nr:hypothetical protein [Chitinophaga sp.]MBV8251347.1 hypothetical protein [Chitinophaga sp.]
MKHKKTYDCVAEVRKIRDKMALKYWNNEELLSKDLDAAVEHFHRDQKKIREERLKREQQALIA